ncbi:MAG TPA: zinc-binding dehydrogenase [Bacteroidales bacterium]|nr:zinc-binding dehydrogenase [Bacteroidales bacterium]
MKPILPETMQAVCLGEEEGQFMTRSVPVPRPGKGEVLVKMAAAPINPSDLARIRNLAGPTERASFIPGVEGSGTVVAGGDGLLPKLWLGKRVACTSTRNTSGTWAEYMVTSAMVCVPLPASISDEQGAMLLVNPLTAVAFFDIARQGGHKAIVNTAGASSLGRIIERLGKKNHVAVIHVVRNEKQRNVLLDQGADYVLDSSEKDFAIDLHTLTHKLTATLVFDAVGGQLTRVLMHAVPSGSSVVVYGNLSGEHPETDHHSLVMGSKKISGFYLGNWLKEKGLITSVRSLLQVRHLLKTGMTIPVRDRFPLGKAGQAVEMYLGSMTAGKVLLMPD